MSKCKVSIILPIYNVEKYLDRCIKSILNQSLKEIEIFLATDGPDSCDKICKKYEKIDQRVHLIYHPGSYGKACNTSMKQAQGEYIGFVETDDWCSPDMFEKLYYAAKENDADVCKCGFVLAYDDTKKNKKIEFVKINKLLDIRSNPDYLSFQPSIWSAIYRRDFLNQNKIKLIEKRMSFIDGPFHMETMLKARKYYAISDCLYFYYQNNPNQSVQNDKASFDGLEAEKFFYDKISFYKEFDSVISSYSWRSTLFHLFYDFNRLSKEEDVIEFKKQLHPFLFHYKPKNIDDKLIEKWLLNFFLDLFKNSDLYPISKNILQKIFYIKKLNKHKYINFLGYVKKIY